MKELIVLIYILGAILVLVSLVEDKQLVMIKVGDRYEYSYEYSK